MKRGATILSDHAIIGEARALERLDRFLDGPVSTDKDQRDYLARPATSGLSEHFAWDEIGPRTIWHTAQRAFTPLSPPTTKAAKLKDSQWPAMRQIDKLEQLHWRHGFTTLLADFQEGLSNSKRVKYGAI